MKLFAFILAILICLLIIQPTVQLLAGSETYEETCSSNCCEFDDSCSQDADTQKQDQSDCCSGGICNPFQACASCCGGIVGSPSLALVISSIKTNHNQPSQNNPVLGFRSDCYHPPEVA